jgi:hypothetical protein
MSEHAVVTDAPDREAPPPLEPDPKLIAHLEGNALALRGYRHEAEALRDAARKEPPADG